MMSNQEESSQPCSSFNSNEIVKCTDHGNLISEQLMTFKDNEQFFDTVLTVGVDNDSIQAHRTILSAFSDYFQTMFHSDLQETIPDKIELKEIDGTTMRWIIDFMYKGVLELSCETVVNVLRAADFLQMNTLIAACCDFMGNHLDAGNCLGIALFAEQRNYTALYHKASSFTFIHFEEVWTGEEFVQLSEEQLKKFFSSLDHLFPHSEEKVFHALVAWVEYDRESREKSIFNLLSCVRFTLLEPKFIIENRHSICKTVECYELICTWLQWHLSPESRLQFSTANVKLKAKLAVVSGEISTNELKMQVFDRDLNKWSCEVLPSPSKERKEFGAVVVNNNFIIAGGRIGPDETNSVECLDLKTNKWSDLPPLRSSRIYPGMVSFNGDLYVIGGFMNRAGLRLVEKYDFFTHEWKEVQPLIYPSKCPQITVHNGFLYVTGSNLDTMQVYNPATNEWTLQDFKNRKPKSFGIAAIGKYLYVVGGFQCRRKATVERYCPSNNTWIPVGSLQIARYGIRCVALNNRLIACGGFDGKNIVDLVEEYNPETDEWTTLAPFPSKLNCFSSSIFIMYS